MRAMIVDVAERHPVSLSVRITLEQYEQLQETADSLAVDLSTVVRTALGIGIPRARDAIEDAIDEARARAPQDAP
jgi:hypothetical protein